MFASFRVFFGIFILQETSVLCPSQPPSSLMCLKNQHITRPSQVFFERILIRLTPLAVFSKSAEAQRKM